MVWKINHTCQSATLNGIDSLEQLGQSSEYCTIKEIKSAMLSVVKETVRAIVDKFLPVR